MINIHTFLQISNYYSVYVLWGHVKVGCHFFMLTLLLLSTTVLNDKEVTIWPEIMTGIKFDEIASKLHFENDRFKMK